MRTIEIHSKTMSMLEKRLSGNEKPYTEEELQWIFSAPRNEIKTVDDVIRELLMAAYSEGL